jgi:hypothetical protein
MTTAEAMQRQLVAYDLLALLIGVLGVDDVTHVLRYWYIVSTLDVKQRRAQSKRIPNALDGQ